MLKSKKHKAFTLIEILITIGIIGIIAAIILVMISTNKDKTRQRAVYAKLRSVQAQANQCLINNQSRINCLTMSSADIDCRGRLDDNGHGANSKPNENTNICYNVNSEKWPVISTDGFKYLQGACSKVATGAFAFAATKNETSPKIVLCCTNLGCKEIAVSSTTDVAVEECKTMAGLGGYTGSACTE